MARAQVAPSPFVGRERELARLEASLHEARGGRGRVVLLEGDPGIGKTRTARELAERAEAAGVQVLAGGGAEGRARPAAVWLEVLRPVVDRLRPAQLRKRIEAAGTVLVDLLPGARARVPDLPAAPELGSEDAHLRTLDALARFLLALASTPTLVLLDDLQWADPTSLDVLAYVGRFLADAPLLVVAAYREELALTHPLNRCLAELERQGAVERIELRGLDHDEAARLVEALHGAPVAPAVADRIARETDGNPFFIGEIVRHLRDEGRNLAVPTAPGEVLAIPPSVRHAVGSRLSRLSPTTGRVLSLAAAFRGPFDFPLLEALSDLDEEALLDAVDEALEARMIRPVGGESYEFAHSLVRQALYDELSPSRQARLHRRIAQALEHVYAGEALNHAAELAYQYQRSALLPGAAHGVRYALAAADQAAAAFARGETVLFLRMAAELAAEGASPVRADVLCKLAVAEAEALMPEAAIETAEEALARLGDPAAAAFLGDLCWTLKDAGVSEQQVAPLVERGLAAVGGRRDLTWARLALVLHPLEERRSGELRYGIWRGFDPDAVAIARSRGDEREYARTLEPMDWRTPAETEALLELVRTWTDAAAKIHGLTVVARTFLYRHGDLRAGQAVCRELLEASRQYGSVTGQAYALVLLAELEAAFGDFSAAQETADSADALVDRLPEGHRLHAMRGYADALLRAYVTGDWAAEDLSRRVADPSAPWGWYGLNLASEAALAYACRGDRGGAEPLLALLTPALQERGPRAIGQSTDVGDAAAAAWELQETTWAGAYRQLALDLLEAGAGDHPGRSSELTVARMAALRGEHAEADEFFERARATLEQSGQRPLLAIVAYDQALARVRAGRPGPRPLIEAARAQFEELGMTYWLGRAEALAATAAEDRRLAYPAGLTEREVEILRLVAAGHTNREIAERLVLSVHTVTRHLANIYGKIGAHNRAEAASFALRHGLAQLVIYIVAAQQLT